jgi:hypothetical protein
LRYIVVQWTVLGELKQEEGLKAPTGCAGDERQCG